MKGHPKYKVGDNVSFTINNGIRHGFIYIVDKYGAFGYDDVTYDIIVESEDCLYKHVEEKYVEKVIGTGTSDS